MSSQHPANIYLDLMETAVNAYGDDGIRDYLQRTEDEGVQEHGFPRLTANLAILIANGRLVDKKDILARMMTLSCRDAEKGKMPPKTGGNEFSVKELVFAIQELEKASVYDRAQTDAWRNTISAVKAENSYSVLPVPGDAKARNWCIFGCASEQARIAAGMGGDPKHVEKYVADQLRFFDDNGMYRDPNQPTVYDFVTRLQFAVILQYGYDGPSRPELEQLMARSAEHTLTMLSACGEIPYGGRSNQFHHNNTFYAALCEWYALQAALNQDHESARRFRTAADTAVKAIAPWLKATPIRHVKNFFPRESKIGCENYAYFDKYMVTMGSWAMLGWQFLRQNPDANIPLLTQTRPDALFATTPDFHLVMANAGDYSVQFDYNADTHYDSDGLGRVHRAGAPVAICMSCPCTATPNYTVVPPNDGPLAILPLGDGPLTPVGGLDFTLGSLKWENTLSPDGLRMVITGNGPVACTLPAFEFDGENATEITCEPQKLTIAYQGWECVYSIENGTIADTGKSFTNRNGRYRRFDATADGRLVIAIQINKLI